MLGREGINIPISKLSFRQNWYSTGLAEKKLQAINLLANIESFIAKAHQLNYSFLIFIMYLFLWCRSLPFYVKLLNV